MDEQKIKKKMNDGWIKSWMMVEVLAVNKKAAQDSLKNHIQRMGNENDTDIIKEL